MTRELPARFRLGRTIALAGVVFAISLAIISMSLLAFNLVPQIFPTLLSSTSPPVALLDTGDCNMHSEKIASMIQQAQAAWMTGDAEGFAALFTEDGEFVVPGQVYRGAEEIRSVTADFTATHDVQIQIRRIIAEGEQAAVEWRWEDIETATGKRSTADDVIVVDFQEDQIKRWREYIDDKS